MDSGSALLRRFVFHVPGVCGADHCSEEDALGLLFEGETNRAIAEHQLNKVPPQQRARRR